MNETTAMNKQEYSCKCMRLKFWMNKTSDMNE